jgi:hypothetical protein
MFRRVCILGLACAMAIAPQWCCCSLGTVMHRSTDGGMTIRGSTNHGSAVAAAPCCCCESTRAAAPLGEHDGDGTCPCRGKPRPWAQAAGDTAHVSFDTDSPWRDAGWLVAPLLPSEPIALIDSEHPPAALRPHRLAGRALLRAYCLLRC